MKRLGKFYPPLNAAKIGTRACDFDNRQILDVCFHNLGMMGLQRFHLFLLRVSDMSTNT